MKKFLIIIAVILVGAISMACTPGVFLDTLNSIGASPGNAFNYASPSNAYFVSPGNAIIFVSPGNASDIVMPDGID